MAAASPEDSFIQRFATLTNAAPRRRHDAALRTLDVGLSAIFLLVSLPVSAPIALLLLLTSGRPLFYRGDRVGRGGRIFHMLKFRTLRRGAEERLGPYLGEELVRRTKAETTTLGGWLRATQLDEIPQLWNVVRGEMSVIGPRPTLRYQVEQYDERQRRRLDVRPGITGWAQVNGRAALPWADRIELDVWYVEHRSPLVDLRILARTPFALFGGTYKGDTGGWHTMP